MIIGKDVRKPAAILAAVLAAFAACTSGHQDTEPLTPAAQAIIDGKDAAGASLLGTAALSSNGTITVIGQCTEADSLASAFICADRHDNVDGSFNADLLPDFAGERIARLYINDDEKVSGDSLFREMAVRKLLEAADTLYGAKVVAFADCSFGILCRRDIDSLLVSTGSHLIVAYARENAQAELCDCVYDALRRANLFTHNIAYPELLPASGECSGTGEHPETGE